MAWNAYQVTFKLLSPMHIGWRKVGNLQQTRSYLIGRNLWGALTARLTRDATSQDYKTMGEKVDCNLTYTYFYPSTDPDPSKTLWPWQDPEEFTWQFMNSYASTALADGHSSEEGSLHETEFIAPYTRSESDSGQPVYLVGYIFEKEGCDLNWKDALSKLRFGGEQGYGWGRVELICLKPLDDNKCFSDFTVNCAGDWPTITVPACKYLLAHTKAIPALAVDGIIEPLVGLETRTMGFGQHPSQAEICYQPGSQVKPGSTFNIEKRGLWVSK